MGDQRLHRRIEAVALLELDGEALGEIARARRRADRRSAGSRAPLRFRPAARRAFRRPRRRSPVEIAGLVDQIDQMLADHAARPDRRSRAQAARRDDRRASSRPRRRLRDCSRRPRARPSRRRPIPNRRRARSAPGAASARGASSGNTFSMPVSSESSIAPRLVSRSPWPFGRRLVAIGASRSALAALLGRLRRAVGRAAFAGALQQRVALELAFHIGGEIEIRELQQLDGLHQLRRHHERLALAEFESLRQRHVAVQYWSGSCLSRSLDRCTPRSRYKLLTTGASGSTPELRAHYMLNSSPR